MNTKRYNLKKKPWKNLSSFSKAIKNIFSHLKSFPSSISRPSKSSDDEPKSFYSPITSRYECSCGYHRRQREEVQWRFGDDDFMQHHHHETAEEKIHLHGKGNYGIYEWKEDEKENGDNLLSTNDAASAFVDDLKQDNDAVCDVLEFPDVDERAEKFIRQIREQWRI